MARDAVELDAFASSSKLKKLFKEKLAVGMALVEGAFDNSALEKMRYIAQSEKKREVLSGGSGM